MPADFESSLRTAAEKVAGYVKDAAVMTVVTKYTEVGGTAGDARLAASTVVRLDGDSEAVVPMRAGAGGALEIDETLFGIHQRNVAAAVEYRAKMMASLLGLLQRGR